MILYNCYIYCLQNRYFVIQRVRVEFQHFRIAYSDNIKIKLKTNIFYTFKITNFSKSNPIKIQQKLLNYNIFGYLNLFKKYISKYKKKCKMYTFINFIFIHISDFSGGLNQ